MTRNAQIDALCWLGSPQKSPHGKPGFLNGGAAESHSAISSRLAVEKSQERRNVGSGRSGEFRSKSEAKVSRKLQLVSRSPDRTTQKKSERLASLQFAPNRAILAQSELALGIDRDLAEGGEVEDGALYFDRKRMLARSKHAEGKAVGE